jgi:DNA-binding NarL/FixJ family response regulator
VTASQTRVLIADEQAATRAGIRAVLEDEGFTICSEAMNAQGAVETAVRERPHIALLDVDIPGSGIAAAEQIATRVPETAVVMLTASTVDADLFDSLRAGAAGYLLKGTDPARLSHALRGVLAGEAAIPRTLVTRIIAEFGERTQRRLELTRRGIELTPREWEVLELLREGLTTGRMAERLFVSPVTVRRHVSTLLRKLEAPDREAAVRMLDDQVAR